MDKVREEFEAYVQHYLDLTKDGGIYESLIARWAYEAWVESRKSIVVQLPRCWNDEQRDYRDELVNVLNAVGIKYE